MKIISFVLEPLCNITQSSGEHIKKKTGRGHLYLLQLVSERNHFLSPVHIFNSFSQEFLLFPKTSFMQERQGYEQKHTHPHMELHGTWKHLVAL